MPSGTATAASSPDSSRLCIDDLCRMRVDGIRFLRCTAIVSRITDQKQRWQDSIADTFSGAFSMHGDLPREQKMFERNGVRVS